MIIARAVGNYSSVRFAARYSESDHVGPSMSQLKVRWTDAALVRAVVNDCFVLLSIPRNMITGEHFRYASKLSNDRVP